jgi:hypothetical protein
VKEYAGKLRIVPVKPTGARFHAVIRASAARRKPSASTAQ